VNNPWESKNLHYGAVSLILVLLLQPLRGVSDHGLDLVLVWVALAGLRMTVVPAAALGMTAGMLQDLCSVSWVGLHLTANMLTAIMASSLRSRIYRERVTTQGLLVTGAVLFKQIILWILLNWDQSAPPTSDAWLLAVRTVIATSLVGFAVSYGIVRFGRRYQDPATA
jgi:rod shape-determining protein MreD